MQPQPGEHQHDDGDGEAEDEPRAEVDHLGVGVATGGETGGGHGCVTSQEALGTDGTCSCLRNVQKQN